MQFAKVVLGLPVEGPFDYEIPHELRPSVLPGARVRVDFRTLRSVGYIVGCSQKSTIKKTKPILELIDTQPILDKNLLAVTRELSSYYACSWGEAICAALPKALRDGKKVPVSPETSISRASNPSQKIVLTHALSRQARWAYYIEELKRIIQAGLQAIVIIPDIEFAPKISLTLTSALGVLPLILSRQGGVEETEKWLGARDPAVKVILGTRSSVFAPLSRLGLIIIDEEENFAYKQDQMPHYHTREVAISRAKQENALLIIGSSAPTLESFYQASKHKMDYHFIASSQKPPALRIIDMKRLSYADTMKRAIFAKPLEDAIFQAVTAKQKTLLFLNHKGYANVASCNSCGTVLKCSRCNINLVFHFHLNMLFCHYCNQKIPAPKICPQCNTGYIKFSGTGTEKIESELYRIFPQARIAILDERSKLIPADADICVATSIIFKFPEASFDLVGVLSIDDSLSRSDFRAGERTFAVLSSLIALTLKECVIQTRFGQHHCIRAIEKNDPSLFYDEELKERRQLHFPPFRHFIAVKLRAPNEERVKKSAAMLFERFNGAVSDGIGTVLSLSPSQPAKLRGNFYWQILFSTSNVFKTTVFLKKNIKDFPHSGIIVTVNVDPL